VKVKNPTSPAVLREGEEDEWVRARAVSQTTTDRLENIEKPEH
jgi:hypothetical protein